MSGGSDHIVGIDLGTTNSVVAAFDQSTRGARVLKDAKGFGVQPSVVAFHPNGDVLVGAEAKQRRVIDPQNTVYSAKRLIGRTFDSSQVQSAIERMPFTIKEGHNKQPLIVTRGGEFAIPEISAVVLDHMRKISQQALGGEVGRAVVTVPANFTDAQRSATATAGAIAGITVVRVLNEPTAAALAYGHQRDLHETIAVYDFGGGTFDVSILKLQGAVFEVLATAGDSFLGGDDIDERLVDHMCQAFLKKERLDLRQNEIAMQRLRAVAEQVKIELSRRTRALVKIDEIAYGAGGKPLDLELEITRDEFLSQISDIIESTFPICREAMRMAGLDNQQIQDVVLVGGTTKMPYVRDRVNAFFGREACTDVSPDEAISVGAALQAMSLERILNKRRATSQPVASAQPAPSGKTTAQGFPAARKTERSAAPGRFVDAMPGAPPSGNQIARITKPGTAAPPPIPRRNTLMGATPPPVPEASGQPPDPTLGGGFDEVSTKVKTAVRGPDLAGDSAQEAENTAASEPTTVDLDAPTNPGRSPSAPSTPSAPATARPDQPTAFDLSALGGAAGAVAGAASAPVKPRAQTAEILPAVVDITPHSLGIATIAGYCEGIIARNSKVPAQTQKVFSTSRDDQQTVRIRVCQGESRKINDNTILGDLVLEGLESRPRGETKIEVTFQIDASGILQVRARDPITGQEQRANLDLQGAQSDEEIAAAQARFNQLRT